MKQPVNFQKPSLSFVCHEDWNKMSPCERGRFCGSCQKTVVDFTQKSDTEIQEMLSKREEKVCGRFYAFQLEQQDQNRFSFRRVFSSVLVLLGLSFWSKEADAQQKKQPQKSLNTKTNSNSNHQKGVATTPYNAILLGDVAPVPLKQNSKTNSTDSNRVYDWVETMPDFKFGGNGKIEKFIEEHLNYHQTRLTKEGLVICQFVVDQNGKINYPKILKGLCTQADQEALRIINLLEFNPGIQDSKKVKVRFTLPVKFKYN